MAQMLRRTSADRAKNPITDTVTAAPLAGETNGVCFRFHVKDKEFGIFALRAMVDQAREGLCYQ